MLAASLFFVVFYSAPPLRLKEVPFADSVTSSIHFFSPAVYALVLAGAAWTLAARRRHRRVRAVGRRLARLRRGAGCRSRPRRRHLVDRDRARRALDRALRARAATPPRASRCSSRRGRDRSRRSSRVPYLAIVWPFRTVTDETAAEATRGWRRFLWVNQLAGFLVTLLLIWYAILTA